MRTFLLAPIAFVVAVSATNLEQRSPLHAFSSLTARGVVLDEDYIPDKCKSSCSTIISSFTSPTSCKTNQCICTNKNGQSYKLCVDCLVKAGNVTQSEGESTLNYFVSSCRADGVYVGDLSVGGSSNSASHIFTNGGVLAAAFAGALAYLL